MIERKKERTTLKNTIKKHKQKIKNEEKKKVNVKEKSFIDKHFYSILGGIICCSVISFGYIYFQKEVKTTILSSNENKEYKNIFIQNKTKFPNLKKSPEEFNNILNIQNYNKIKSFSSQNLNIFLDILKSNTTSPELKFSIENMKNISYNSVLENISKLKSLSFLTRESINLYNGVLNESLGLTLSPENKISSLNNYSTYWSYGLKIGDELIGLNNKMINKGVNRDYLYQELLKNNSQWRLKSGQKISVNIGRKTKNITDIINVYSYNDVLIIQLKKINSFISYYLYLLTKNYLETKNYSGLVLDLSDVSDHYYLGIDSFLYLLTGNNKDYIATFFNELNKNKDELLTKKTTFEVPDWYINKIKTLDKVVVVNQKTEGSPEVMANYLYKNGAVITGYKSKNNNEKYSVYSINNNLFSFKTNYVFIKNNPFNKEFLNIEKEKYPNFIYNIYNIYNK